jgi:signal transduction histidine kinase
MSHEVNNSVGAVGSLLDSLRTYAPQLQPADRDDYQEAIVVASTRLDHLRRFMSGFAEVARLPPPELRPHDVRRLLDELLVLLRPGFQERRIEVRWSATEAVPEVAMDRNQIEQVLVNVLQNSIEAIGENGTIELSLRHEAGRPVLRLRDSGPGVPDEARHLLFTPFFSTKRDGRGLGLTLVREILAQHRFGFGLENSSAGGAEFRIELAADSPSH